MSAQAKPKAIAGEHISARSTAWHELGVVSLLLMEIALIVPWFRSFRPAVLRPSTLQSMALLLGLALAVYYVVRLMSRASLNAALRGPLLLLLLVAGAAICLKLFVYSRMPIGLGGMILGVLRAMGAVFEGLRPELTMTLAVIYAWWRGLRAAGSRAVWPEPTALKLRLGVLLLALFAISHRGADAVLLFEALPLFFGGGLLAMAISHADVISQSRTARGTAFTGGWLSAVVVIVLITLVVGYGSGILLQSAGAITVATAAAIMLFIGGLLPIAPLIILGFLVFAAVVNWLERVWPEQIFIPPPLPDEDLEMMFSGIRSYVARNPGGIFAWIGSHTEEIMMGVAALAMLLFIIAVVRAGRLKIHDIRQLPIDKTESLLSRQEIASRFRKALKQVGDGLSLRRRLMSLRDVVTASVVRRIYARLLSLGEDLGKGRAPSETPLEYLENLQLLFPDHREQARTITHAYVHVRYGE
ncbi:MAG: DUF4129 domain-containing protein, partial [Anaerolineales bacterium]